MHFSNSDQFLSFQHSTGTVTFFLMKLHKELREVKAKIQ